MEGGVITHLQISTGVLDCEPMHILHLISSSGFFGAERVVLELAKAFKTTGERMTIGIFLNVRNPQTQLADYARTLGLTVVSFPCRGKLDLKTVFEIAGFVRKRKISVVHGHGYKSNLYAYAAALLNPGTKKVTTCHNWIADDIKTKFYYLIDKKLLKQFDAVISVSEEVAHIVHRLGIAPRKRFLVKNGLDIKEFSTGLSVRTDMGIDSDHVVIGTVGRLSEEKGIDILLQCARIVCQRMKNLTFVLIGDGPMKQQLTQTRDQFGLTSRVIFTGARKDVVNLYHTMDIYLLTSRTEGTPMALLEAMAAGLPAIASNVGGIPDIIENGQDGILVQSGDAPSFADAVLTLADNPDSRRTMGRKAQQKIDRCYASRAMAQHYIEIYRKILK